MVVPFGVSVGDFIAGIELVHDIIQALEESAGAGAHYRGVILWMKNLEAALDDIKNIESDDVLQKAALMKAATQCGESIKRFFAKVYKYDKSLQLGGSKRKWVDALRKVQWSLYTKKEVEEFQAEIQGHTMSIQIRLEILHRNTASAAHQETQQVLNRLDRKIDEQTALQLRMMDILSQCVLEVRGALKIILVDNLSVISLLTALRSLVLMPRQVPWENPVTFEDAHGCKYPIHTQWVSCWDDFEYVLLNKFRSKPGFRMVQSGKYSLIDVATKKESDRSRPYESTFRPGRKINMSMVFKAFEEEHTHCPSCGEVSTGLIGKFITCPCGLTYSLKKADQYHAPGHDTMPSSNNTEQYGPSDNSISAQAVHDSPGDFVRVVLDLMDESKQIDSQTLQGMPKAAFAAYIRRKTAQIIASDDEMAQSVRSLAQAFVRRDELNRRISILEGVLEGVSSSKCLPVPETGFLQAIAHDSSSQIQNPTDI